jgi:hypothetical protein
VLGLRFKALALIPAIVLVLISVAATALAQGADLGRPLGAIALTFIALQAALFAEHLLVPALLHGRPAPLALWKGGWTHAQSR